MGGSQTRTRIELAVIMLLLLAAAASVRRSQAGDELSNAHAQSDCMLCHPVVADIAGDNTIAVNPAHQCKGCHPKVGLEVDPLLTFHKQPDRNCLDCHSFHHPDEVTAGGRTFVIKTDSPAQQALCSSCHGQNENTSSLSPGHLIAAKLIHSDYKILAGLTPSQACLLCHSEAANVANIEGLDLNTVPRFNSHSSHPLGVTVTPEHGTGSHKIRRQIASELRLYNSRIECQTCHSLSAQSPFKLATGDDRTALCIGCHQMN
jgi:predicted CXXCH cytochrome family protein